MPRDRSIIRPNTSSLTEVTKPALACVTSTPALLAAATSTLRMSMAQRRNATSFGRRSNSAAGAGRLAVGNDEIAVRGGADERFAFQWLAHSD